jgi:hypothetical protein
MNQGLQILISDGGDGPRVARRKDSDLLCHREGGRRRAEGERIFLQKARTTYESKKAEAAKVTVRSIRLGRLYIGTGEATKVRIINGWTTIVSNPTCRKRSTDR